DKVFVFLGREDEDALRFSVKLPTSGSRWLDQPCAEPTGYGLGKSGWVTFTFGAHDAPGLDELRALLDESYRAVAPRTLVAALDGKAPGPAQAAAKKARARPKA
ncbi:MAG TPA: MmcQ/YjbR family DNA-binding protein, partial [Planctomycetota bacterium]